jgi:hypothetical protein
VVISVSGEQPPGSKWAVTEEQVLRIPAHQRRPLLAALQQLVIGYDNSNELDLTTLKEIVINAASLIRLAMLVKVSRVLSASTAAVAAAVPAGRGAARVVRPATPQTPVGAAAAVARRPAAGASVAGRTTPR